METRPIPEIGDDEVLVKILAVGICAGDAKCFAGAPYFWGELGHTIVAGYLCDLRYACSMYICVCVDICLKCNHEVSLPFVVIIQY